MNVLSKIHIHDAQAKIQAATLCTTPQGIKSYLEDAKASIEAAIRTTDMSSCVPPYTKALDVKDK